MKGLVRETSFKSGVTGRGIDGESEGGDCDGVICARSDEPTEESEQNEVDVMKEGADSTGEVMHI